MCGLAGYIPFVESSFAEMQSISIDMADALLSRGPDDRGVWVEQNNALAMSFRRLAILELSPAGKQPMESYSGRYHICFNGEIYNHLDLRKNLTKDWVGRSDTETILQAIEENGLEIALQSFVGMFALAVWDSKRQELTLARDRMGEKPLYYGWVDNALSTHP
jgi:asparagine synthase (glutamine-hydrolysing)